MRNIYIKTFAIIVMLIGWPISGMTANDNMTEDSPIPQMAGILYDLNHYPDDEGKIILKDIIDDESASSNEKTLAGAILRFEHKVNSDDEKELKEIIGSSDASEDEKDLAAIILSMSHHPTDNDKKRLTEMMK